MHTKPRTNWDNSRVAEAPAQIAVCDGKEGLVSHSQRYSVDVGPRLGTEASVEVMGNTAGTGDPEKERTEHWKLGLIQAQESETMSEPIKGIN